MNYKTINPDNFIDQQGSFNYEYFKFYCSRSEDNLIFNGYLDGTAYSDLIFNNIVKAKSILTSNIGKIFPDLIHADEIRFYTNFDSKPLHIGNLKSVNSIFIIIVRCTLKDILSFIDRQHIKIIDKNKLIINNQKLIVNDYWQIGQGSKNGISINSNS